MANPTPKDLPHSEITIVSEGDLTIKVIEHKVTRSCIHHDTAETKSTPSATASIRVSKAKLLESSEYFRLMLQSGSWVESNKSTITVSEDSIKSMHVWLLLFHGKLEEMPLKDIDVVDVWHVLQAGDKYGFYRGESYREKMRRKEAGHEESREEANWRKIRAWFQRWDRTCNRSIDRTLCRQLLFPAYAFDDAWLFQYLTKNLVYQSAFHISESNPSAWHQMHLPARIVQQLNAAKGRLRIILHRELFRSTSHLVDYATCNCKATTVFNYLRGLRRCEAWPLDDAFAKSSACQVLYRLRGFRMPKETANNSTSIGVGAIADVPKASNNEESTSASASAPPSGKPPCSRCDSDWKFVVEDARETTETYFDGLCLDCMDSTKNVRPGGDGDDDYWVYNQRRDRYDEGCRVKHGEPTWYFSFMGRREKERD